MKKRLVIFLLFSQISFAESGNQFEGQFECTGQETGEKDQFKINMTIQKQGEVYTTRTQSLKDDYQGVGVGIDIQNANALAVGFRNRINPSEGGVCIFSWKAKNTLEGIKTYIGEENIVKIRCHKIMNNESILSSI